MSIRLNANPLEVIGVNPLLVRRFCSENGASLDQLSRLLKLTARHASTPFHTDRNQTPGAEQIFKDIQQAESEIDNETGLKTAVEELLQRPADQIEQLSAQFNLRLALLQQNRDGIGNVFSSVLNATVLGNEMFDASTYRVRRFCVTPPDLHYITTTKEGLNFNNAFPCNFLSAYEYFIDNNGNLIRYKLERYRNHIPADKIKKYKPKPGEIIFRGVFTDEEREVLDYTKDIDDKKGDTKVKSYDHFFRSSDGQIHPGIKIIGSLSFPENDIDTPLKEALGLSLESSTPDSREEISRTLLEGLTLEQFKSLVNYYSSNPEVGILIALNTNNGLKIILLGQSFELHDKTPHLYNRGNK